MNRITYGSLVMSLLLAVATGCGEQSNEVEVSGSVTIDGEPVPRGSISFVSTDGGTATGGGVIQDGVYTAKVPPGEKVVLILGNKLAGTEPLYADVPDSPTRNSYERVTPEAYNAEHLTPLKATITDSQEGLNFELTKDVPAP